MFSCLLCKISFPSEESRLRHYNDNRAHTSELKCKTCQSSYATLQLYYSHMTVDHPEKFCVFCLKEFKSYRGLRQHEARSQEHQSGTRNIKNVNSPPNLNVIGRPPVNNGVNNVSGMSSNTAGDQIIDIRGAVGRQSSSREVAYNLRSQAAQRAEIIGHHRQVESARVHGGFLHPEWEIWPGLPVDNQTERAGNERPTPIRDAGISISTEVELESPRAQVAGSETAVSREDHTQRQIQRRRSSVPGAYELDDSSERTESENGHDTSDANIFESANANQGAEISTTRSSWWPSFFRFPRISLPYGFLSAGHTNTAQTPRVDETSARSAHNLSSPDTDRLEISQLDPGSSSSDERRDAPTLIDVDRRSDSTTPADNNNDETISPSESNDSSASADNEANIPNETPALTPSATLDSSRESSGSAKCRICLELETDVSALKCGHVFGTTCIEEYFAYQPDGGCPFCRRPIVHSDIRRLFLSA